MSEQLATGGEDHRLTIDGLLAILKEINLSLTEGAQGYVVPEGCEGTIYSNHGPQVTYSIREEDAKRGEPQRVFDFRAPFSFKGARIGLTDDGKLGLIVHGPSSDGWRDEYAIPADQIASHVFDLRERSLQSV